MPADLERGIFARQLDCGVGAGLGHHERGGGQPAFTMRMDNGVVDRGAHAEIVGDENNLLGHGAEIL